jgi:hypothetical protein
MKDREVGRSERAVPVSGNASRATTTPVWGGDVYRVVTLLSQPPELSSRSVRENGPRSASKDGCHEPPFPGKNLVPNCVDTAVHTMESPSLNPLLHSASIKAERLQLIHRNKAMLKLGDSAYLPVPVTGPTGRNAERGSAFRPVGGEVGGHGATVAGPGAWMVRGMCRLRAETHSLYARGPAVAGPLVEVTRLLRRGYARGRPTSCRPCPACRRAFRRRRLPSRGARR